MMGEWELWRLESTSRLARPSVFAYDARILAGAVGGRRDAGGQTKTRRPGELTGFARRNAHIDGFGACVKRMT
jgi:hypothetical protein